VRSNYSPTDLPPEPTAHRPPQEMLFSFSSTCKRPHKLSSRDGAGFP
jgi:hypothetical protein